MPAEGNPTLETARLILRRLNRGDLGDIHAYTSDPRVAATVSWDAHGSMATTRRYLDAILDRYSRGYLAPWGIEHREAGAIIGTVGFSMWDRHSNLAELAYAIAQPYWGQGLTTEAAEAVVAYGFNGMGLNRIEARCLVENAGSWRVMEKIGMQREGMMRRQLLVKGAYRDLYLYAILRDDFRP